MLTKGGSVSNSTAAWLPEKAKRPLIRKTSPPPLWVATPSRAAASRIGSPLATGRVGSEASTKPRPLFSRKQSPSARWIGFWPSATPQQVPRMTAVNLIPSCGGKAKNQSPAASHPVHHEGVRDMKDGRSRWRCNIMNRCAWTTCAGKSRTGNGSAARWPPDPISQGRADMKRLQCLARPRRGHGLRRCRDRRDRAVTRSETTQPAANGGIQSQSFRKGHRHEQDLVHHRRLLRLR